MMELSKIENIWTCIEQLALHFPFENLSSKSYRDILTLSHDSSFDIHELTMMAMFKH